MRIDKCRICKNNIVQIFSLGKIPPVNYYPSRSDFVEEKFPLNLCLCENCGLVQIDEVVSSDKLFSTYHYVSSTSAPLKKHLESLADYCIEYLKLKKKTQILDIGCNDGVLLSKFKSRGLKVLGVDPAKNVIQFVRKKKIVVFNDFFGTSISIKIKNSYGSFDLIVATNTFAHIIDLDDFLNGIKKLLSPNGVFVIEVGYLPDMILKKNFDSIYHEHVSYFSLQSLSFLFTKHGLEIFDAELIDMHGGSVRVFIKNKDNEKYKRSLRCVNLLSSELKLNLDRKSSYKEFADFVKVYRQKFRSLLVDLKRRKKKVAGWGSPAKSVVILNYCGVGDSLVDYIVDSTDFKQNKYMPGVKIPIFREGKIMEDKPDYLIFFIWTYKDYLTQKLNEFKDLGIKIIIPFPEIEII